MIPLTALMSLSNFLPAQHQPNHISHMNLFVMSIATLVSFAAVANGASMIRQEAETGIPATSVVLIELAQTSLLAIQSPLGLSLFLLE